MRRVNELLPASAGPASNLLAEGYLIARMGATAASALGLLTLLLAAAGLDGALGFVLGGLVIRVMFGGGLDPVELVAATLAPIPLLLAAFLACKIPAARAARVDPTVALRHL